MVVLIELESGIRHGYQVHGPNVTIEHEFDNGYFSGPYTYVPGPAIATITARGVFSGLAIMPDVFEDEPEIEPHREALPPVRYALEAVEESVDVCLGEVVE